MLKQYKAKNKHTGNEVIGQYYYDRDGDRHFILQCLTGNFRKVQSIVVREMYMAEVDFETIEEMEVK